MQAMKMVNNLNDASLGMPLLLLHYAYLKASPWKDFFFFFYYNTPVGISYAGVKLKAFSLENEEIGYSVPTPSLHARLTLRLNIPLCFPYMSRRIFNKELGECLADPGPVQSAFCPKAVSDPTRHCWIKTKEHFLNTNILYRRSFSSVH